MTAVWALCLVLAGQPPATGPRLTFQDGRFTVEAAGTRESVAVNAPGWSLPAARDRLAMDLSGGRLEFDRGGLHLTTEHGRGVSRLPGLAVSKDLFTEEEIAETEQLVAAGRRRKEVSAVSGYVADGSTAYLLLRWDEKDGTKWLELLVAVDMSSERPTSRVLGRFAGFSFARGLVSDRMRLEGRALVVPVQNPEGWGRAAWNLDQGKATYARRGAPVDDAFFFGSVDTLLSVDRTEYGSTIVGIADPGAESCRLAVEFRGALVGGLPTRHLRFARAGNHVLFNLESGAEVTIDGAAAARGVQAGILVWTPADKPKSAVLYTPNFRRLATWTSPAAP